MAKTLPEKDKTLIEELKYENQMNNLQPWIKALYKQVEKDPANPGGWSKWVNPEVWSQDLFGLINSDENKDEETKEKEKLVWLLCLSDQEKRFLFLCNTVLGLGLTEEKFLKMSETDKKALRDRIIGA